MEDPRLVAERVLSNVERVIIGKSQEARLALVTLLCRGHLLIEDVPGVGKTMLARALARSTGCHFSRIQFTPDLLPADVTGVSIYQQGTGEFVFRGGPIMAEIVLADEVNRATPKTQSALLEVMQEHSVTVGKTTHVLEQPYFVLATQNPLEMEGTYPLPEAQLDRFLFKLQVGFPSHEELHSILDRTTGSERPEIAPVLERSRILEMRGLARDVPVARHVQDYAIRVLEATHPDRPNAPDMVKRFVRFGASPRGAQACLLAAKIQALFDGRFAVGVDDVRAVTHAALRHRIILNFEGEAEGVKTDTILDRILETTKET
jgi:MoxR-like ATPase